VYRPNGWKDKPSLLVSGANPSRSLCWRIKTTPTDHRPQKYNPQPSHVGRQPSIDG